MFTNPTRGALVQVLRSLSYDAITVLALNYFGARDVGNSSEHLLYLVDNAAPQSISDMLVELLSDRSALRADAPTKNVYDRRLDELRRRLRSDGFEVQGNALLQLLPGAQPAARISDYLEQTLDGELDQQGEIRRLLRQSHDEMSAAPPDYNGSTTRARIALETIARCAAAKLASKRSKQAPLDRWGAALIFLRMEGIISASEEEAIAKVYTLISPGAHVPKGLSDEQWALLARTFALSSAYFLAKQYDASK